MKALFLAGGIGSRLKEITEKMPKPMLPILEQPLLSLNINKLKKCNIDEIVLSTCYLPQKIKEYFGEGQREGIKISYQKEKTPLGTGGAIKAAENFFSKTFFVFNADIISDVDLKAMVLFHEEKKADVTIAVTEVKNPENYGVIEYDSDDYITSFKEKPKPGESKSHLINAGIYILEPSIFKEIAVNEYSSIERDIYPLLLKKKYKMAMYRSHNYWRDLGTPQDYLAVHQDILSGKVKIAAYDFSEKSIYIGEDTRIGYMVQLISPVYIGSGSTISAYTVVGPYTVLGANSAIGENSRLRDCVILPSVQIGAYTKISNAIVLPNNSEQSSKQVLNKTGIVEKSDNLCKIMKIPNGKKRSI